MKFVKYGLRCFVRIYFTVLYEFYRLTTRVNDKKVLFISDVREKLGGNLACVWDYLDDNQYLKTSYLKSDRRDVISIKKFNKMIYDFATAKYILLEDYFRYTSYVRPKKAQEICQLWHACGAFKKFGYSRANGNEHIKIHKGYRKYTKVITSSDSIREKYAEAFGVSIEKVRATGIPRTDIFFDESIAESARKNIYQKYPMINNKKVILFAPTYRGLRAEDATYGFDKLDYERIYNEFHEEYVFVIKWHPALYNNLKQNDSFSRYIKPYSDFYIDLSAERDINELLLIADILITDYSSVIFEYALLDKPIVYFTYDLEKYENSRGLYYDFKEYIYGEVARCSDELIYAIRNCNMKSEMRKKFVNRFMSACDGKSTEKVCRWIFDGTEG